jgi:inner membrane protein
MMWFNHLLVAGAVTAVVAPPLAPVAMLGSTAPDWLEWVSDRLGKRVKHRAQTHYLSLWLVALVACLFLDPSNLLTAFCFGGASHVVLDALTVTGVPWGPGSDRRFHLLGGRFRTGDPAEYAISVAVVCACAFVAVSWSGSAWYPFFYDWSGLYDGGVIDGAEWRANRFRFL